MDKFVDLVLTCGSWQEAQRITDVLLEQKLVACVEQIEIQSKYLWHSAIEENKEIKLVMKSIAEHFDKVEAEVAKLHSYETFVLEQIPVTNISDGAKAWLQQELEAKD
jgi:periplasmic divalent cation tolerance protein